MPAYPTPSPYPTVQPLTPFVAPPGGWTGFNPWSIIGPLENPWAAINSEIPSDPTLLPNIASALGVPGAVQNAVGLGGIKGANPAPQLNLGVLSTPFGDFILAAVGIGLLLVGAYGLTGGFGGKTQVEVEEPAHAAAEAAE